MDLRIIPYSFEDWKADKKEGNKHPNLIYCLLNGFFIIFTFFNFAIIDLDFIGDKNKNKK